MGPNEETIITGGYDQAVRVWDMRSRSYDAVQTMKPFADSVTSVAVTAKCVPVMSLMVHRLHNSPSFMLRRCANRWCAGKMLDVLT
jgi:WD40 repeat protein